MDHAKCERPSRRVRATRPGAAATLAAYRALLIGVLSNGLVLMNVSPYYQPIIKGAIIVGAVLLDQVGRRRSR